MNVLREWAAEPPIRKLAFGVGVFTAVVLLSVAGFLATDLVSGLFADAPSSAAAAAPAAAPQAPETSWLAFFGKAILTLVVILSLAVIAPLVGALCLFGLLRKYGKHLGPLIHVEYPAAPPMVIGPLTASSLGAAESSPSTAQPLTLGPSFEQERQYKAEMADRMQVGVLQQLFEDNVKLQKTIEKVREEERETASDDHEENVFTADDLRDAPATSEKEIVSGG